MFEDARWELHRAWLAEASKGQARVGSCAFCFFRCCLVLVLLFSRTAGVRAGRDDVCFTCLLVVFWIFDSFDKG